MGALAREMFKISEAMEILSMSRTVIYEQMRNGRLRYVKEGRATLIARAAIRKYIALLETESEVRYGGSSILAGV